MPIPGTDRKILQIEHFATARMIASRLRSSDFEDIRRLDLQPRSMKSVWEDGPTVPDHVTRDLLIHDDEHWEKHGFGFWIFRDRGDGRSVGRGGLKWYSIEGEPVVGLAYAVVPELRGRGLATEMATTSLGVGFQQLQLDEVWCWASRLNLASQRVMEKVGFRYQADLALAGMLHRLSRLSSLDWAMDRGGRARGRAS